MKQIRILAMSLIIGLGFLAPFAVATTTGVALSHITAVASPDCADAKSCAKQGVCVLGSTGCSAENPDTKLNSVVKTVINILSVVVGVASVIMIILAGFKFVTSSGSSEKVASARNTILYAVIGLVIVALAQTIVFFVLNKVKTPTP